MTHEIDLPCSDCGSSLEETTIATDDLPVSTNRDGSVTVAECPHCNARYYPEPTLTRLFEARTRTRRGDD